MNTDSKRLDIVTLINNSPISKLSTKFHTNLLHKLQTTFTNDQQQLFVASFYCYLNHDPKKDFIIDLDHVWKWIGFSRKDPAKRTLEKHFTVDIDYKIVFPPIGENPQGRRPSEQTLLHNSVEQNNELKDSRGGFNKEQILMNVICFKKLCLKAGTKKADEIHDYYLKLEELLQETIKEESDTLNYN
jgi:hypothetical protein